MGVIGTIRKHSWVAVAIVGIAIVAFIVGDLTKNRSGYPDMGKINGTTVTYQHFNNRLTEVEDNYKRQQGIEQIPSELEYQLREQVWQSMVDETLLGEEYDKLGLRVSNRELSDMYGGYFIHPYLRQSFTNPQTGQYDYSQVRYIVENFDKLDTAMRLQWVEMEKSVRNDRQMQKYSQLVAQGFYMPTAIANQIVQLGSQSCDATVVALSYADVADAEVSLTEKDYSKYYNEHKAEFRIYEEYRDLDMVVFNATPTAEDLQAIEDEVMTVWDTLLVTDNDEMPYFVNSESDHSYDSSYVKTSLLNPTLDTLISALSAGQYLSPRIIGNEWVMAKVMATGYRPDSLRASAIYILNQRAGGNITRSDEDAKNLADSVAALIRSGRMNFEAAVSEYSDDPQKSSNQGDMGWQLDGNYGFLNEEVVNTPVNGVFVHKHPQEVGYFVVMVTGKTPAVKKYRLALITREINPSENTMRNVFAKAQTFAANNRTYAEMQAAVAAQGMQMRSVRTNAMMQNLNGIPNTRSIVQWAYNDKTEVGDVADQVFESENMFVVVALRDIFKKGFATLDQVRPMIEPQVLIEKKGELLMAKAGEAMKGSQQMDAVATKLSASVDTVSNVSFNSYYFGKCGMEPKMLGMLANAKANALVGPVKGAQGVYVANVMTTDEATAESPEMIRATFQQEYMQKSRMLSTVLRTSANITDQRNKFF